ncbi:hypothetical protein [Sphingomonas sp. ERG5]|uniref:hypothetical protein n=1 Tax=Sphingomonas sp. ERG5 TaxID=1381597 RepID=UPI00054B0823|nr:hypothetical protein [Sphingomonas sp. ERG5]
MASQPARASLRIVDAKVVTLMSAHLVGQTDEKLMPQFGISYNTWRKVRAGEPIRRSVAERLEQRLRHQGSAKLDFSTR